MFFHDVYFMWFKYGARLPFFEMQSMPAAGYFDLRTGTDI